MTRLPIHTSHWDTEKRVQVQTSFLIFKHFAFILAAARSSDTAKTWKYQEGRAVKGCCHWFQCRFVLVMKDALCFSDHSVKSWKGKMDNAAFEAYLEAYLPSMSLLVAVTKLKPTLSCRLVNNYLSSCSGVILQRVQNINWALCSLFMSESWSFD